MACSVINVTHLKHMHSARSLCGDLHPADPVSADDPELAMTQTTRTLFVLQWLSII